jgi:hypothetical protein
MRSPVVKAFALGMVAGSFLTASMLVLAFPVKAEPDSATVAYAATYGEAVCMTLDDHPTFNGIIGIGNAIVEDGLTGYQAGGVIGLSVMEFCPRHLELMNQFAAAYREATV